MSTAKKLSMNLKSVASSVTRNDSTEELEITESVPDENNNVKVIIRKGHNIEATVVMERFTNEEIFFLDSIIRKSDPELTP